MRFVRTLAISGLLGLAAAAPAAADSIAYIKDYNVWLANPDGSHQVQITHDGNPTTPYRSPSQADDGTLAAAHGGDLVRLAQSGKILAQFTPPLATDSTGQLIQDVPQQVAISPDGNRIAYVYSQPSCPPAAPCGVRQELLYSYSDHTTPVATFGEQTNLTNPSWIDNSRVLAFGGHFHQVNIDSPGGGNDDAAHWFDDPGNEDVGDGELSRQGDRLALVRSYGQGTHIALYHVTGGAGGPTPEAACYTGTDASLAGPSWSPDGTKLAFEDSQGIEVMPLPQVVAGDCPGASSSAVIVPGATAPDWGPASIAADAGSFTGGSTGGSSGGSTGGSSGHQAPPPKAIITAAAPATISLRTATPKRIVVRVTSSVAGRITASLSSGRRSIASARAVTQRPGTVSVSLRLTGASTRALRRSHAKRLTLTVALAPTTGARIARTKTVRVTGT